MTYQIAPHGANAMDGARFGEQNAFSLNQYETNQLKAFCRARHLSVEGSKLELIKRLLQWKQVYCGQRSRNPAAVAPMAKLNPLVYVKAPAAANMVPQQQWESAMSTDGYASQNQTHRDNGSLFVSAQLLESKEKDSNEIAYEHLRIGRKLGSGGYKDCYAGVYKGDPVAVGELRVTDFREEDLVEMKHEIGVLKQLRHDNIVRFIGVCYNERHLCIVTELCENGDLFEYMRKNPRPDFSRQLLMMHDIAHGVAYLHSRRPNIIHRDLKSQNVLVSNSKRAKINDFGLARIVPRANTSLHTQCGTPNWQAPEMWSSNPSYTEKVDVYACGLIFWEILQWADEPFPFHYMKEHELYEQVRDRGVRPDLNKLVRKFPSNLLVLISQMWHTDPKQRPSMNMVLDRLNEFFN